MDEAGFDLEEIMGLIRGLKKAGICSSETPVTFSVTKGVTGDARTKHQRIRQWEESLLSNLFEISDSENMVQVNLSALVLRINCEKKPKASDLMSILEAWEHQKWIRLKKIKNHLVRIENLERVEENLENQKLLTESILDLFYESLGNIKGARLRVIYNLEEILEQVNQKNKPIQHTEKELKDSLHWLHQQEIIRLTEGLSLFHQSLKVKVFKGARIDTITTRYPEIKNYYEEQEWRTNVMIQYGKIQDSNCRQQLARDYFQLSREEFENQYPYEPQSPPLEESLNPTQLEIVKAEDSAILAIAGPGSGKTRTIVYRVAKLVKVDSVIPDRILLLAYNRNAVRELRIRLQKLLGNLASRLRIYTFHGLALSILGKAIANNQFSKQDDGFKQLLQDACDLIEYGDEFDDEDEDKNSKEDIQIRRKARRIKLLGNLEYIFVDEYQDVTEDEYRLIKLISGLGDSESREKSQSVQIKLCVIGDDDQNIREFNGASVQYIQNFRDEYQARQFILSENYRSTENIIKHSNQLIARNSNRIKQQTEEQVRINAERQGCQGKAVQAFKFNDISSQAAWITQQIRTWISQGVSPQEIAILSRKWDNFDEIILLLEKQEIAFQLLRNNSINLVRHLITYKLIDELQSSNDLLLSAEESVENLFKNLFTQWNHGLQEPTVKVLLKIARDIDQERGYGFQEFALPISDQEILTSLFEFNANTEVFLDKNAALLTSCHGSKGLEFQKVILLADDFRTNNKKEIESERRLFYVAMTRAKEELILCSTQFSQFLGETGIISQNQTVSNNARLPQRIIYLDLTPKYVKLSHQETVRQQEIITNLREGQTIQIKVSSYGDSWVIATQQGQEIGKLSDKANGELKKRGIEPKKFQFQSGEVTVGSIYRHLKTDNLTGEILEDWFVVIPQIRICR